MRPHRSLICHCRDHLYYLLRKLGTVCPECGETPILAKGHISKQFITPFTTSPNGNRSFWVMVHVTYQLSFDKFGGWNLYNTWIETFPSIWVERSILLPLYRVLPCRSLYTIAVLNSLRFWDFLIFPLEREAICGLLLTRSVGFGVGCPQWPSHIDSWNTWPVKTVGFGLVLYEEHLMLSEYDHLNVENQN